MSNQIQTENELVLNSLEQEVQTNSQSDILVASDNPVIQRALRRLKESQTKDNHVAYYTKHGSHSTHSKGSW